MSDEIIVQEVLAGNTQAFEQLLEKYQRKIFTIAYRFLGNYEDANDIAQETFLKAYKALPNFRGEASLLTWLGKIATNLCRDELRKRSRRCKTVSLEDDLWLEDGSVKRQIADEKPNPEEEFEKKEVRLHLQHQLNLLKEDYRMIVVMRDINGLSYEEISTELGLNIGTVKSRLNRARRALGQKFCQNEEIRGIAL